MDSFFENPFVEGNLAFHFHELRGATRYETWNYHRKISPTGKKAVDFIYASTAARQLFFTEIKDFRVILHEGRFKQGGYSRELAEDIARKIMDSISGYENVMVAPADDREQIFALETKTYRRVAVFHWEHNHLFDRRKVLEYMQLMTHKLKSLVGSVCDWVSVESSKEIRSEYWTVRDVDDEKTNEI